MQVVKSQVVLLQTAHSWANAGVLLGAPMHRISHASDIPCIGSGGAFEAIKPIGIALRELYLFSPDVIT